MYHVGYDFKEGLEGGTDTTDFSVAHQLAASNFSLLHNRLASIRLVFNSSHGAASQYSPRPVMIRRLSHRVWIPSEKVGTDSSAKY